MTHSIEVENEMAAWERYRSYVMTKCGYRGSFVFCGDEASHGLWRDWKAAWNVRDGISRADTRFNHLRARP